MNMGTPMPRFYENPTFMFARVFWNDAWPLANFPELGLVINAFSHEVLWFDEV
jgi:hypothetical protein